MQSVSTLFRRLLADPEHVRETKANIAGTEYGQDRIYACSISGDLFPDVAVGSCISRELDLTVEPEGSIPRRAEVKVYMRLVSGAEASEWFQQGTFYVDTRAVDEVTGLMTLHCFDAMLKAEEVWLDPTEDAGEWPMSQASAAAKIARRMGTGVDQRSRMEPDYRVEYPNDLTMREVLCYIAACHGGNWSITETGKLLLMPVGRLPEETSFLVDSEDGGAILFGEVRIIV